MIVSMNDCFECLQMIYFCIIICLQNNNITNITIIIHTANGSERNCHARTFVCNANTIAFSLITLPNLERNTKNRTHWGLNIEYWIIEFFFFFFPWIIDLSAHKWYMFPLFVWNVNTNTDGKGYYYSSPNCFKFHSY